MAPSLNLLRRLPLMALGISLVLTSFLGAYATPALAQGPNLIQNPGFERPYVTLVNKENCAVAAPWVAWYREGTREEVTQGYRFAPEYKAAFRADFPGNRVRNGELAQQWFHTYGNFEAGVFQQVSNIPIGSKLRFEMWGMSWSCDKESKGNCGGAISGDPSPMHFKIGIDPTGGVDPYSATFVWSPEQDAYDSWHQFQVEAVAQRSTVTVFVYSYPTYRSQDNNIYTDDASLVLVAPPPAPTKRPTAIPTATPIPTKTPVPTTTPVPVATTAPTMVPTIVPTQVPPPPTCPPTTVAKPAPTCPPQVIPTPETVSLVDQLVSGQGLIVSAVGLLLIVAAFAFGLALGRRRD